jgi:hypothetical protein
MPIGNIYTPFALKLYAYGLGRLHDPNWVMKDLVNRLNPHFNMQEKPYLLHSAIEKGFLYHLGLWIYEDFLVCDNRFEVQDCKDLLRHLSDIYSFLISGGAFEGEKWIARTKKVTCFLDLFCTEKGERRYLDRVSGTRRTLLRFHNELIEAHTSTILEMSTFYASNYADRVFHDRQLCAFISEILVAIGFNGRNKTYTEERRFFNRSTVPSWAKMVIYSRDRGKCAQCDKDIVMELSENAHIDHIIPLSRGGCNDLVNLQLLCSACNLLKSNNLMTVSTSIPPYITHRVCKES